MKKTLWPKISRIIEHDKRQGTAYDGTQGLLTRYLQAIWSFLWDLRNRDPKFSKQRLSFCRKRFWPHFFPYYPLRPTSSKCLWGSTRFFGSFDASYKTISLTTKRLLKPHVFENKFKLSSEEKILAYFFGNTEWHKPQGTIFKGPKGFLTKTMEGVRSFLYDLTGCWKHKFLKKKGKLSGERKNLA